MPDPNTLDFITVAIAQSNGWFPADVTLDDVDVSMGCKECSVRHGWVVLFERDDSGKHFVRDDDVATVTKRGKVTFTPRSK